MAICGEPSGSPVWPIGWQITSRQPSKLGCLRVAVTLPSTRANNIRRVEIRNPKPEARKKSEIRNPKEHKTSEAHLRISGFGLLSDFGFRYSDLSSHFLQIAPKIRFNSFASRQSLRASSFKLASEATTIRRKNIASFDSLRQVPMLLLKSLPD